MIFALAAGLVTGYVLCYLGYYEERKFLRNELRVAHAQIAHAVVHDRAVIPQRIDPAPEPEPLPSELQALVEQWDSPESRAVEEHRIRGWLAEGYKIPAIQRQYGAAT